MGNYDGMWPPPALVPEAYTFDHEGNVIGPRTVITDVDCDECDGTGNDDYGDTCGRCRGVGTVERTVQGDA